MAMISMRVVVPLVFLLFASIIATCTQADISCDSVLMKLYPCFLYEAQGGNLSSCCNGISQLKDMANSTSDRQGVCRCLKSLFEDPRMPPQLTPGIEKLFAALPVKCNLKFNIDASVDCNSIQ